MLMRRYTRVGVGGLAKKVRSQKETECDIVVAEQTLEVGDKIEHTSLPLGRGPRKFETRPRSITSSLRGKNPKYEMF